MRLSVILLRIALYLATIIEEDVAEETIKKLPCKKVRSSDLARKLGPAFNARYMSVEQPRLKVKEIIGRSADTDGFMSDQSQGLNFVDDEDKFSFKVSQNYTRLLKKNDLVARTKREAMFSKSIGVQPKEKFPRPHSDDLGNPDHKFGPWSCTYKYKWFDLGSDHFPRYLRSVECDIKVCWFGFYECTPKAFTVTVLKRVNDSCFGNQDDENSGNEDGNHGVENWEFEERAVSFCCECLKIG